MNLRLERRPVAITSMGALPRNVAKFSGTVPSGCTFLAARIRGPHVLHRAERSLQLRDRCAHAQHPPPARSGAGVTRNAGPHDGRRIHSNGGSAGDPAFARNPCRRRLRAARRHTRRPRRRGFLRTCGNGDAAAGVGHSGRSGRTVQYARPADLHVGAGGDGVGNGGERRVCRKSRLYESRSQGTFMPSSRPGSRANRRRDRGDQSREPPAPGVPHRAAAAVDVPLDRGSAP